MFSWKLEKLSLYPGWLPESPFRGLYFGMREELETAVADTQNHKGVIACPRPGRPSRASLPLIDD
jgi:hypothetical protein